MDVAFVQNAENNVNGDDRSQYQDGLIGKRPEEGGRGALECTLNAGRHVQFLLGTIHGVDGDRKSTRLNSSHGYISYAVFCLKKKNNTSYPLSILQSR